MKVNNVGNTNNSPNFGIRIAPKALINISEEMGLGSHRIFGNITNPISTIRKFGSRRVEMSDFKVNRGGFDGWRSVEFDLTYPCDDVLHSSHGCIGIHPSKSNIDITNTLSSELRRTQKSLLSYVMDVSARKGHLRKILDIIKADFPEEKELIENSWKVLQELDKEAPRLLELQKAEAAARRAARQAERLKYRKQHPILSRLFG